VPRFSLQTLMVVLLLAPPILAAVREFMQKLAQHATVPMAQGSARKSDSAISFRRSGEQTATTTVLEWAVF